MMQLFDRIFTDTFVRQRRLLIRDVESPVSLPMAVLPRVQGYLIPSCRSGCRDGLYVYL